MTFRVVILLYWWSMIFPKTGIHFRDHVLNLTPADTAQDNRMIKLPGRLISLSLDVDANSGRSDRSCGKHLDHGGVPA